MEWIRRNAHWVLLVAFLLSVAGAVGLGLVGLLAAALAVATTEGVIAPLLGTLIPFVLPVALLAALSVVFLLGTLVTTTRKAVRKVSVPRLADLGPSWPRSDALVRRAEALERQVPPLERFDLPAKFEPTPEQRRERLKERYVAGEVDEFEFERRMAEIVDGSDGGDDSSGGDEGDGSGGASTKRAGTLDDEDDRERDPGGTNIAVE